MKIICTCGAEIPLYNIEDVVFERAKYSGLYFPPVECSKCGKQYALKMELEYIKTNPKMPEGVKKSYCEKYPAICSSGSCKDGVPIMKYSVTAPRGVFRGEFGDPYAVIELPDGQYKEVEPAICVCRGCEDAKRVLGMEREKQ